VDAHSESYQDSSVPATAEAVFDSLYLRVEDDWAVSCQLLGLSHCFYTLSQVIERVNMLVPSDERHHFLLFLAGASAGHDTVHSAFTALGFTVVHKYSLVPDLRERYSLSDNDMALLELVLCSRSRLFIGNAFSSFSMLVTEHRAASTVHDTLQTSSTPRAAHRDGRDRDPCQLKSSPSCRSSYVTNAGAVFSRCNRKGNVAQLCPALSELFLSRCINSNDGFAECWQRVEAQDDEQGDNVSLRDEL